MVKKNILVIAGSFKEKFGKYVFGLNSWTREFDDAIKIIRDIKFKYGDKVSIDFIKDNEYFKEVHYTDNSVNRTKMCKFVGDLDERISQLASETKYDLILDFSIIPSFKIKGFKLENSDNKYMGDTFTADYSNTVIGLDNQIDIFDSIKYPIDIIRFDYSAKKHIPGTLVTVTDETSYFDVSLDAEKLYLTENEAFVDLTISDLLEDIVGLFDRKIKYLDSTEEVPCVTFSKDVNHYLEKESIKSGSTTVIKSTCEAYISAVLDQNDSNDEYSKYVFCSPTAVCDEDVLLHEIHVKTGRNRIVSSSKNSSFILGIPSKIVTKDAEILDFVDGEINAVQSLCSLWNLDGTKRIFGSRLYKFDNCDSVNSDSLEAIYDKKINKFVITALGSPECVIGTMGLVVKCDESSTISEVEFELDVEEQGHHVVEAILKTFADITVVAKQEQLADFLIDKYGFERREDGAAIRKMA